MMYLSFLLLLAALAPAHVQAPTNVQSSLDGSVACGFPGYACARTDYNTFRVNTSTVPPNAGPNTCVAGDSAGTDVPGIAGVQACGNLTGMNTIMTDPNYNNVKIVRITDRNDANEAPGCTSAGIGQGGEADHIVFSADSKLITIFCMGGSTHVKMFNPSTMQVDTTYDPQGFVRTTTGEVFSTDNAPFYSLTVPGKFFQWINSTSGVLVQSGYITNGIYPATLTTVADFSYGIPCWRTTCPAWVANTTYQPGTNIVPTTAQGNATNAHVFQLVNFTACTSGSSTPNFAEAFGTMPYPSTQTGVIDDGTCQWADMYIPAVAAGGSIVYETGKHTNPGDTIFSAAFNNRSGQDAAGGCYVVVFNSTTGTYDHYNTCTGNVYHTVCRGGSGYACTGGTFTTTYLGNVINSNTFANPSGTVNGVNIHNFFTSPGGAWGELTFNNCSLVDVASGQPVLCGNHRTNSSGYPVNVGGANQWQVGSTHYTDANKVIGTGTPGHDMIGFNAYIYSTMSIYDPSEYTRRTWTDSTTYYPATPVAKYLLVNAQNCSPILCWSTGFPSNPNVATNGIGLDQHESWADNLGGDNVPVCMGVYAGNGANQWPSPYPWSGEVICMATDGSGKVFREANAYDTETSINFNAQFNIGALSTDGNWWGITSNWMCTLGDTSGNAANRCAYPFQLNYPYRVGEFVGPIQTYGGIPGRIYKVTTAGTSGTTYPTGAQWCNTTDCTVATGTAVLTYVGQATAREDVFLVKLQ